MAKELYIFVPSLFALAMEFFVPYFHTLSTPEVWFSLPTYFNALLFLGAYVLFGFTLYEADKINNVDIFYLTWALIVLNLIWSYYRKRNNKYTIIFLFVSLLFGYFVYNEIFLSSLVDGGNSLFLNLYSVYIIWMGFVITMTFQYVNFKNSNVQIKHTGK